MSDDAYARSSEEALERALSETPAYVSWRELDPGAGASLDERYAALPSTDKAFMRAAGPEGFVPRGRDLDEGLGSGEVELVSTSGTTDERVANVWNQRWWNFSERESWKLNSVTRRVCTGEHREAILTSARNVGFLDDEKDLSREGRSLGRLLFLNERSSPALWTEPIIRRIALELSDFRPQILEANPSYLARFCLLAARLGIPVSEPEAVVFTYENPSRLHIRQIREVLQAPMISSYGTTETGYAFMECERGLHHLNAPSCRADLIPLDGAGPGIATLRITPFGNDWVSLLRFDAGDIVRLEDSGPCACGRDGALLLRSVEGRTKSLTRTPDGRPVTPGELDRALALEESLLAYQLLQEGRCRYALGAVLGNDRTNGAVDRLKDLLAQLYGKGAVVRVETRPDIEPEPSGKYLPAKIVPAESEEARR